MNKIREFGWSNGPYLLAEEMWARLTLFTRNRILARQFRVHGFSVGRYSRLRGVRNVTIGNDFHAGDSLWLEAVTRYERQFFSPRIVIGTSVRISHWVHIAATNYVEIGDHCLLGSKVIVTDHGHGQYTNKHSSPLEPPAERFLDDDRRVIIGRNVWLGDGVVVMPDVMIGEGSVVGANSVVTCNIPSFSIAVGVPAVVIKTYDFTVKEWRKV